MPTSALDPRVVERTRAQQRKVDQQTAQLALYYHEACGDCLRVLRTIERLRLKISMRNIRRVPAFRDQLLRGGGSSQVPCLQIQEIDGRLRWLYEPDAIIDYLEKRFA